MQAKTRQIDIGGNAGRIEHGQDVAQALGMVRRNPTGTGTLV